MKSILTQLRYYFSKLFTVGCSPRYGEASNRITIFTNVMMVFGIFTALSVAGQLEKLALPSTYIRFFYLISLLTVAGGMFNYFHQLFLARVFGLLLMIVIGWNAVIIFGKSFNGHYIFFAAVIYSVVAFSKTKLITHIFIILLTYINLPLIDILSHKRILPITGFSSYDFPVSLLLVDTLTIPIFIIIIIWIEKWMADRYEKKLEEALLSIQKEKQKIKVIFDSVDLGILMLNSKLQIEPEYSAKLETLFKTDRIAGQTLFELIFSKSSMSSQQSALLKSTLLGMLGEDELNWDLNSDHLPKSIQLNLEDSSQYLSLSWSPLIRNNQVNALVIGIKDVTDEIMNKNKVAHDQLMQNRAQEILSSLIKVGTQQTLQFISDFSALAHKINENALSKEVLRDLHTLKGEARLLGLKEIAHLSHELEFFLVQNTDQVLLVEKNRPFQNLAEQMQEAAHLMFKQIESNEAWSLFSYVGSLKSKIQQQLDENSEKLKLGKVTLEDSLVQWPKDLEKPVQTILLHAVQNAVDHGYLLAGKKEDIQLHLSAQKKGHNLILNVEDFGAGIDMKKIEKLWENLSPEAKAQSPLPIDLLFLDKLSTTDKVTLTSGRGVGLAVIKSVVDQLKGKVSIANSTDHKGAVLTVEIPFTQ